MERIYHHYLDWEELDYNMWGSLEGNTEEHINKVFEFMSDNLMFERFMLKVATKWKYSCENALTDTSQNRIAWLGQAACAYALGMPCKITKKAWNLLDSSQQDDANKRASNIINRWEQAHNNNKQISLL